MESIEEMVTNLNPADWENQVYNHMCHQAQTLSILLLERMDDQLMENRESGLRLVGFRKRWVVTMFGTVHLKRRLYRDKQGNGRFLLDEAIGLAKRSPLSLKVRELSVLLACHMPFGKCEALLHMMLPAGVSHTTIHRQVSRIAGPALDKENREVAEAFKQGRLPQTGSRRVPCLFVEGDGVNIALQREKERRAEIKAGIAYEGWEPVGSPGRYRLKGKTPYMGLMNGDRFWDGFSLVLGRKYDLGSIKHIVVGGDGAGWVKHGAEAMGGYYQLDRFHLRRELLRALKGDVETANRVYRACLIGDVALADKLILQQQGLAGKEGARDIARVRSYIINNISGLKDYRLRLDEGQAYGLRGMGAMESNVDKMVANRMKKRGMSWTRTGAARMSRLILMSLWGDVHSWPACYEKDKPLPLVKPGRASKPRHADTVHYYNRVNAGLPSLSGPHASRPWAKVLKSLAYGINTL